MSPDVIDTPAPVEPAPVETPAVELVVDESLAAHEASFGKPKALSETPEIEPEPKKERHRAKSQQAGPEDVPRIQELSRKNRELQAELDRVKATASSAPAAPRDSPTPAPVASASSPSPTFTEAEPTLEQFEKDADPYASWQRALARYDRRKDEYEARQQWEQAQRQQWETQQEQAVRAMVQSYHQRCQTFAEAHPDFYEQVDKFKDRGTPVFLNAIASADNGPELVYHVVTHPALLDDIELMTGSTPLSESSVASMQRWLASTLPAQAGTTGSAVVQPLSLAPRPPNPVRTGPMRTGDELPGDDSTLAEHEKAFSHRRR